MSTPDADNRREYYRIEDTLALEFRPLREDEIQSQEVLQDDSALFNLLSDLHWPTSSRSTCCGIFTNATAPWPATSR